MKTKIKTLKKIALVIMIVAALAMVLSSCSSNTVIDTSKTPEQWKDTKVNTAASTGFLDVILSGIGTFLGWITLIMPAKSYILTLFIFGIILEIVMLPFGIKQQKNSIKQAKLRPKEMAIRKKYAGRNDQATQQKVTMEIQELYQKENFNPMGGCLPLLLQLPIVVVLYWIVVDPIQYVCHMGRDVVSVLYAYINANADMFGGALKSTNGSIEIFSKIKEFGPEAFAGIKDFCASGTEVYEAVKSIYAVPANFNVGPVNFGLTPAFDFSSINALLLLVPVLTFVVYFFSMRISRKFSYQPTQNTDDRQQACSNKMMEYTMPLMSVWMAFIVPAAVGVYWIFKSILGTVKQFIMSRVMPLPVFTEEDYKAAEKEYLGKHPKKIEKSANVGKVRSLHHIDDDDYDENGNYIAQPEKTPEPEEQEKPEEKLAENKLTEGAKLKDDSDKKTEKNGEKRGLFGKKNKKD
ncbi:MAG: YidC/Oxa1 family membrane protein insertase [Ruminococcaceae bacterium]|nr:YidC/Oxa1 family membrane protein insertase [Oscillospiraceae bacterium]